MSDSATPMPPASRLDDKTIYGRELRIPLVWLCRSRSLWL